MKLNNIKQFKNKLTKLKIIETKTYKKNIPFSIKTIDIISRLKKALQIIHKYHVYNKRILFVGIPHNNVKRLKSSIINQKHLYIPSSVWLNGIITNQKSCFKYLYKNQTLINPKFFKVLSKFNKKINLIVVLESNFSNNIVKESYIASIPTIFITPSLKIENYKISYKIPGSFNFLKRKNKDDFFFSILLATLKKANKLKKKSKKRLIYKNRELFKRQKWIF